MSNEFKDLYNDFTDEQNANYELCMKYPIIIPHDNENFQYEYTMLDFIPMGWKIAFGEKFAADLQEIINKLPEEERDEIWITEVKEKFCMLRVYLSNYTDELNEVLTKYEKLSVRTCIRCGEPATKISQGYHLPWCDECAKESYQNMIDIKNCLGVE